MKAIYQELETIFKKQRSIKEKLFENEKKIREKSYLRKAWFVIHKNENKLKLITLKFNGSYYQTKHTVRYKKTYNNYS